MGTYSNRKTVTATNGCHRPVVGQVSSVTKQPRQSGNVSAENVVYYCYEYGLKRKERSVFVLMYELSLYFSRRVVLDLPSCDLFFFLPRRAGEREETPVCPHLFLKFSCTGSNPVHFFHLGRACLWPSLKCALLRGCRHVSLDIISPDTTVVRCNTLPSLLVEAATKTLSGCGLL